MPEIPTERIYEALDLMVQAGWISEYARDAKHTAIQWTEHGKQAILAVFAAYQDLGPEKLNQELWMAVAFIANLRFEEGGPGFRELGITE
jgi:DNA-binding PadR family transcriptional regulator